MRLYEASTLVLRLKMSDQNGKRELLRAGRAAGTDWSVQMTDS